MDLSLLWIALLVAFVVWKLVGMRRSPRQLAEIQAALDDGALLLDVRSPGEFARGHLPGALNHPVATLPAAAPNLRQQGRPVVVYCASGTRAGVAAKALQAAGVGPVLNLGTLSAGGGLRFPAEE